MFGNQKPQILDTLTLPLDKTGTSTANLVIDEVQSISSINAHKNFLLIPELAPFFLNNLVLQYDNGSTITTLTSGVDYAPAMLDTVATLMCGKSVYKAISIFDVNKNGNIAVTYQSLGGSRAANVPDITAILAGKGRNSRIIDWSGVQNIPAGLNPSQHLEDIANIKGQDLLIASIAALNNVLFNRPTINLDVNVSLGVLTLITPPPLNIGVFFGGISGNFSINTTAVYDYAANTFQSGNTLGYTISSATATSTGSTAYALGGTSYAPGGTSGGVNLASSQKYTYANNTASNGTNMTYAPLVPVGAGNSNQAVIFSGSTLPISFPASFLNNTNVYTYSNDICISGNAGLYVSLNGTACGNQTKAIFEISNYVWSSGNNITTSYAYASGLWSLCAASLTANTAGCASGTSTDGYFYTGHVPAYLWTNITSVINYNTSLVTQGASLDYVAWNKASASNGSLGIINGGNHSNNVVYANSCVHNYVNNTVTGYTNISHVAIACQAATSPCLGVNY
jgi:hypothetical protein